MMMKPNTNMINALENAKSLTKEQPEAKIETLTKTLLSIREQLLGEDKNYYKEIIVEIDNAVRRVSNVQSS